MPGYCDRLLIGQKSKAKTPDLSGWAFADRQLAHSENQGFQPSPFSDVVRFQSNVINVPVTHPPIG
ncbi:MAG: hypothetical protein RLZZ511_1030 [Cyanobacteriota bacterium]